jgi:uroporphyrin-3 C-methyltransferase
MNKDIPALTQPPAAGRPNAETVADGAPPSGATAAASKAPPADRASSRSAAANWALLLAVVALAGAGWASWQAAEMRSQAAALRDELASRLEQGNALALEARGVARQQQEAIAALQGRVGVLDAKVEATEGQAAALEGLYQEFLSNREQTVVAEAEQAMTIAAQQLQLAGNVEAALVALQTADARLAAQDRGQLMPLRRALGQDIETLKRQQVVDVPGVALRLERLMASADAMPLAFERELAERQRKEAEQVQPAPAEGVIDTVLRFAGALARDVWRDIIGLLRVERLDQAEPVLLAPEQNAYLRENLKVRLLTARLALLARDGRSYGADLAQAQRWVDKFFDLRDERVRAVVAELKALQETDVAPELPTLTESFAALRMLQAGGGNGRRATVTVPEAAPAPSPEPEAAPAAEGEAAPATPAAGVEGGGSETVGAPPEAPPAAEAGDSAAQH